MTKNRCCDLLTVITDVLQNVNVFGFCFVLSHDIF